MKIIETPWEIENLGKKSVEIIIEGLDSISEIEKIFEMNNFEYIVVKTSYKNSVSLQILQHNGFQFIETQISLILNIKDAVLGESKYFAENFGFEKINTKDELNNILSNITEGTFSTDRIARDPVFGLDIANRRYKNWIRNSFGKSNIEVFSITERGINAGFLMTGSSDADEIDLLIGGIYAKYQGSGYGYNFVYQPVKYYISQGKTRIRTKVSSNNLNVIKLYLSLGYKIENMDYVLIKHQ